MQILHVSSVFANSKVHGDLYKELDGMGIKQVVFCPIRIQQKDLIGKNEFESAHTSFVYAPVIKPYHRYVFHIKQQRIYRELQKKKMFLII